LKLVAIVQPQESGGQYAYGCFTGEMMLENNLETVEIDLDELSICSNYK